MTLSLSYRAQLRYWLRVFALYALVEACIQLLFFFLLNTFGKNRISIIEFHVVMWCMQCLLIWPIWGMAWLVRRQHLLVQILVNAAFYFIYTWLWFGPVQDAVGFLYNELVQITRSLGNRQPAYLDRGSEYSYINYQLLKHAYRLSWFFLAAYLYRYRLEEKKRLALAVANRELQMKLLTWHLNPSFYFKTILHLREIAAENPVNATGPILQLAKVMEYVIYEAKEKLIDINKEIQFLGNYVQLLNGQPGNYAEFEVLVAGDPDHLKIAPLLITGLIDRIALAVENGPKQRYCIAFQFQGNNMLLQATHAGEVTFPRKAFPDAVMAERLQELYPGRFSLTYHQDGIQFHLQIRLDHG